MHQHQTAGAILNPRAEDRALRIILMNLNMGLMERGIQPGEVIVTGSSCLGPCEQGPTVVVYPDGTWYTQVKEEHVSLILDEHIKKGTPVAQLHPDSIWS